MKKLLILLTLLLSLNANDTIVNVPLSIIKDSKKLPKDKVLQEYKNVKFYVYENKDNTFSIFFKNSKNIKSLKTLKFNFKGANYIYDLNQKVGFAITTLMERCDGVDKKGLVNKSKRDGIIKGFPEKKCEAISQKVTMLAELAQEKAELAQEKAELAQEKAELAQEKAELAQEKAELAQTNERIAQTNERIAQTNERIVQNKEELAKLKKIKELLENLK